MNWVKSNTTYLLNDEERLRVFLEVYVKGRSKLEVSNGLERVIKSMKIRGLIKEENDEFKKTPIGYVTLINYYSKHDPNNELKKEMLKSLRTLKEVLALTP